MGPTVEEEGRWEGWVQGGPEHRGFPEEEAWAVP